MQKYMKSDLPYLGVRMPALRRVCRTVFADHPLATFAEAQDAVLTLWREAQHREERYAAIELTGERRYGGFRTLAALPVYEELVVTGAWWDYVDAVAHRVRELLVRHPRELSVTMRDWSRSPDRWERRVSIICQVGRKVETDLALLYDCIEANLADRDFFVRKAIGWALRDYAWTDPEEVDRYVRERAAELSPLSRREATKNLPPLLGPRADG